jgi:hypothetical protein
MDLMAWERERANSTCLCLSNLTSNGWDWRVRKWTCLIQYNYIKIIHYKSFSVIFLYAKRLHYLSIVNYHIIHQLSNLHYIISHNLIMYKKFKMSNLTHMISILSFIFIVVFYATRWVKFDPVCIWFIEFINQLNLIYICICLYLSYTIVMERMKWIVDQFFLLGWVWPSEKQVKFLYSFMFSILVFFCYLCTFDLCLL